MGGRPIKIVVTRLIFFHTAISNNSNEKIAAIFAKRILSYDQIVHRKKRTQMAPPMSGGAAPSRSHRVVLLSHTYLLGGHHDREWPGYSSTGRYSDGSPLILCGAAPPGRPHKAPLLSQTVPGHYRE